MFIETEGYEAMTIDMVREYLPNVRLRVGCGRVVEARVTGRQNRYATVYAKVPWGEPSYYFSWEAVARAVNNHTVLRI
uniref:Uncharacterized protein n=1 Tax=viral metagenome TaxID=1070528 RepID=A0A6M3L611_9ZZZZ